MNRFHVYGYKARRHKRKSIHASELATRKKKVRVSQDADREFENLASSSYVSGHLKPRKTEHKHVQQTVAPHSTRSQHALTRQTLWLPTQRTRASSPPRLPVPKMWHRTSGYRCRLAERVFHRFYGQQKGELKF